MSLDEIIRQVQRNVGVKADGIPGPKTWAAILARTGAPLKDMPEILAMASGMVVGKASSFADPKDVTAFRKCKAQGKTDAQCFKVGDNGIGCWGDDTTNAAIPYVAVRPDDMIAKWGSVEAAKHKPILLTIDGQTHTCILGDRMPWAKNVKNGAVLDAAPGAQKLFNLKPPFMVNCGWRWA